MRPRLDTLAKKLLWSVAVPGLLVALVGFALVWRHAHAALARETGREALALAEFVAQAFAAPQGVAEVSPHRTARELLTSEARLFRSVSELRVAAPDGKVRWSRDPVEVGARVSGLEGVSAERLEVLGTGARVVRPLGGAQCAGCHAGAETRRVGVLEVRVGEGRAGREVATLFRAALAALVLFALTLAVAVALSLRVFLTRPLKRLAAVMRRAEEGELVVRAETRGDDEIARLGGAFNRMLARLTSMKVDEIDNHRDLALAREKLALKEALERRVMELGLLVDVTRSLATTLELPELLKRISQLVAERLGVPRSTIMLKTPEGDLEVCATFPASPELLGVRFALGEGVCGRAAETLSAVYVPDLADPESAYSRRGTSAHETGALLCQPIVLAGELLGVLNLQRPAPHSFRPEEIELGGAVADQAALAVHNARLHAETVALAVTDPLTGLANRRQLFARLEHELARARRFDTPLSLLMIDIDHFKALNDAAGHRAGDETLREVCELLRRQVRQVDTLARYGGEEFMLLLPQVAKADAREVAEKLRRAVEGTAFSYGEAQPGGRVTISVGVATYPEDARVQDTLVDCADAALYASKRGGRNGVSAFESGMELHPGRERGPLARKRVALKG